MTDMEAARRDHQQMVDAMLASMGAAPAASPTPSSARTAVTAASPSSAAENTADSTAPTPSTTTPTPSAVERASPVRGKLRPGVGFNPSLSWEEQLKEWAAAVPQPKAGRLAQLPVRAEEGSTGSASPIASTLPSTAGTAASYRGGRLRSGGHADDRYTALIEELRVLAQVTPGAVPPSGGAATPSASLSNTLTSRPPRTALTPLRNAPISPALPAAPPPLPDATPPAVFATPDLHQRPRALDPLTCHITPLNAHQVVPGASVASGSVDGTPTFASTAAGLESFVGPQGLVPIDAAGAAPEAAAERPTNSRREQREAEWAKRRDEYDDRARERQLRAERRTEAKHQRLKALESPPEPPPAAPPAAPPSPDAIPEAPEAPEPTPRDVENEETHERALLESEEAIDRLDFASDDPKYLLLLAQSEAAADEVGLLKEDLKLSRAAAKAKDEEEAAQRAVWEVVREAVWEEETTRKFLVFDADEAMGAMAKAAAAWQADLFSPTHPVAAETAERAARDELSAEELATFHLYEAAFLQELFYPTKDAVLADEDDAFAAIADAFFADKRVVELLEFEHLARVNVMRGESVARGIVHSQAREQRSMLVDRLTWLVNCGEVDARFALETLEAEVYNDLTYDCPGSLGVVNWVMRKLKKEHDARVDALVKEADAALGALPAEEDSEREAVYEMRSFDRALIKRDQEIAKRNAVKNAIAAAAKLEETLPAPAPKPKPAPKAKKAGGKKGKGKR